ncbi:MAG: hypothetical protein ABEN55_17305, partial [Bradymonadaceae bacterium]
DAVASVEFESREAASTAADKLRSAIPDESFFGLPLELLHDDKCLLLTTDRSLVGHLAAQPSDTAPDAGPNSDAASEHPEPTPASPDAGAPSDLRRAFLDGDGLASLYLNGRAVARMFDNRLPPESAPARLLERFTGGLVTLSDRKHGVTLEGRAKLHGPAP